MRGALVVAKAGIVSAASFKRGIVFSDGISKRTPRGL